MTTNNKYTKTMEGIKAPQAAVDKAVQAALEAEHNRAASPKKSKGKSKFIQFVSAVAACAVAACGITAISMTTGNYTSNSPGETSADSKNYFSLVVNAAEINKSNVQIGKIVCDQSMWSYLTDNTSSDDEDKQRITDFTISPIIDLSVNCTGNNIKYVTYSVEGAAIQLENITPVEEGTVSAGELRYSFILPFGMVKDVRKHYFLVQTVPPPSEVVILLPLMLNVQVRGPYFFSLSHKMERVLPST